MKIAAVTHPEYNEESKHFKKWRLTYRGGSDFIESYLKPFSVRESYIDFIKRRELTYVPAYAKSALIDVKNAIHQRMVDVARKDGPLSWQEAINGGIGGVDYKGNSLNSFMGNLVLDELLPMRKVGVFVDRQPVATKSESRKNRPYLYMYNTEDIRSWDYDEQNNLINLLLRNHNFTVNKYGLPDKTEEFYLHYYIVDGKVVLDTYNSKSELLTTQTSSLTKIPFVIGELSQSLLTDIADYQIAALNLASGDLNYAQKSNYPFYTEQYDPASELYTRQAYTESDKAFDYDGDTVNFSDNNDGTSKNANRADDKAIEVGSTQGRRYPTNTERPAFINPSPDPLRVSMEKQEVLKREVRELINLNLSSLRSVRESAESKKEDSKGKEEGLSNIGLELEHMERQIAEIWAEYESTKAASIAYPTNYSLRSDAERRTEAENLTTEAIRINSSTYQKEMAKESVALMIGHKVSQDTLDKIFDEIDSATVVHIDPEEIRADHEAGLVGTETASKSRGYPEGEAEQAKIDHADRLARIAAAQGGMSTAQGGDTTLNDAGNQRKTEKNIDPNAQRGDE